MIYLHQLTLPIHLQSLLVINQNVIIEIKFKKENFDKKNGLTPLYWTKSIKF